LMGDLDAGTPNETPQDLRLMASIEAELIDFARKVREGRA
jgi:hypothetical protein